MNGRSHSRAVTPSLRERIRETTTTAILSAAEEVFAAQGLHAAHMGDIAARAGVAVGTLYNHFKDRESLLAGLLAARRAALLGRIDEALRGSTGAASFRDRLRALLVVMLDHAEVHQKFFHILMQGEVGRYQETFPSVCNMPSDTMKEIFGRVDKLMKQGLRGGELRAEVGDLAAVLFMGMVRAMAIRNVVLHTTTESGAQTDRLLDSFLRGVAA
jgi:AcrR family transcriptional regulator